MFVEDINKAMTVELLIKYLNKCDPDSIVEFKFNLNKNNSINIYGWSDIFGCCFKNDLDKTVIFLGSEYETEYDPDTF